MDWLNIILVSISMSVDCMTIGATDGIQEPGMKKRKIFFIALVFGLFQGIMPLIGYTIGYQFRSFLESYIPWIAFALLSLLGIKNIIEWAKERFSKKKEDETEEKKEPKKLTVWGILVQGIATSIDALSIGFVYLDNTITEALIIFSIIAVTTFLLSLLTTFLGKKIGGWLVNWAGLIAGIVFIAIGLKILIEYLVSGSSSNSSESVVSAVHFLINTLPIC